MGANRTVDRPHPGPLPKGEEASRREAIRAALRSAALAGLAALCGVLGVRSRGSAAACGLPGQCRACPAFGDCQRPEKR